MTRFILVLLISVFSWADEISIKNWTQLDHQGYLSLIAKPLQECAKQVFTEAIETIAKTKATIGECDLSVQNKYLDLTCPYEEGHVFYYRLARARTMSGAPAGIRFEKSVVNKNDKRKAILQAIDAPLFLYELETFVTEPFSAISLFYKNLAWSYDPKLIEITLTNSATKKNSKFSFPAKKLTDCVLKKFGETL